MNNNKWKSLAVLLLLLFGILLIMKTEKEIELFSLFALALIIGGIFAWIIDAIGVRKAQATGKNDKPK